MVQQGNHFICANLSYCLRFQPLHSYMQTQNRVHIYYEAYTLIFFCYNFFY